MSDRRHNRASRASSIVLASIVLNANVACRASLPEPSAAVSTPLPEEHSSPHELHGLEVGIGGAAKDGALGLGTSDPESPVTRGELPWWESMKSGIYRVGPDIVALGVGDSINHHHIAEGFLHAKVEARLSARRSTESVLFHGNIPEPVLVDLFVTRERRVIALYSIKIPADAVINGTVPVLTAPDVLRISGRHRIGRHIFEGDRHLFLECDVEGPIANPDWGRTRASA